MNPLVKTCLIESNKESADEATYESDPYFDDNLHTFSSHSSSRGNLAIPTPQLGNNIVRENKNRDPYEVYNYAKSLGNGSMVSDSLEISPALFTDIMSIYIVLIRSGSHCTQGYCANGKET
jgi:hypothetical protein